MPEDKIRLLNDFIINLEADKSRCTKEEFLATYDQAISMAKNIRVGDDFYSDNFDRLSRYVSDCVPWSEELLAPWNKLRKLVDRSVS